MIAEQKAPAKDPADTDTRPQGGDNPASSKEKAGGGGASGMPTGSDMQQFGGIGQKTGSDPGSSGGGDTGGGGTQEVVPTSVLLWGNISASLVVFLSITIVLFLLWILHDQIQTIETSANRTDLESFVASQTSDGKYDHARALLLGQLLMESDAQFLRTERAQSLVGARLLVSIGAELVGLTLVVIGGALVLARIRGTTTWQKRPDNDSNSGYDFASNVPGVVLCGLGAGLVVWALNTSVHDNALQKTTDASLYLTPAYGVLAERLLGDRALRQPTSNPATPAGDTDAASADAALTDAAKRKKDVDCLKNAPKELCQK